MEARLTPRQATVDLKVSDVPSRMAQIVQAPTHLTLQWQLENGKAILKAITGGSRRDEYGVRVQLRTDRQAEVKLFTRDGGVRENISLS